MTKMNGGGEGRQQDAMDAEKPVSPPQRSPERALLKSAGLTVLSFLIHILFLLLVDPLNVLHISKDTAIVYSAIPLGFGAVFLLMSIYNFIIIAEKAASHIVLLLVVLSFGSMSIQGLLGIGLHYLKLGGHE